MKNYSSIEKKSLKELAAEARLYRHDKSGARVLTISCQDDNKVFGIAFRTPAEDSTGVAHITEHSVLCGSEKYPLKDPFVELAKGSLNTYLNALTYADKTVYPVASRNEKDLDNLMDVYLNAVFYPNSNRDPRIMQQEGWHYELDEESNTLSVNGVVYNEMKGVFSSPDSVMGRQIMHALFPDTTYGNESGGDPKFIPELTFEQFRAFHERYYHPSNSYIFLYGDMDMEKKMAWLDECYLSSFEAIDPDSEVALQPAFSKMHEEEIAYSVGAQESLRRNTFLSWNAVVHGLDNKRNLAFSILDHALISSPGAPIRKALLDAGIGEDIYGGFEAGIRQPYFSVIAKGTDKSRKQAFLRIIEQELRKQAENGIDKKVLLSALNHDEFEYREADYGRTPKGLVYCLTALDIWLYGGKPWEYLECGEVYQELRQEIENGYFEQLIREELLDNPHSAVVICRPERGLTEKTEAETQKKLENILKSMDRDALEDLKETQEALRLFQEEPTAEEDMKKLPLLNITDISKEAEKLSYREDRHEGILTLYTEKDTRGIAYLKLLFNTAGLTEEELSYAGMLRSLLGNMATEKYTLQDLNSEILLHSGGIGYDVTAFPNVSRYNHYTGMFILDIRVMYDELHTVLDLIAEILHATKLDDRKRLKELLFEGRSRERMRIENAGHSYAVNRSTSYFSGTARYADLTDGISYYHFIEKQAETYEKDPELLESRLKQVAGKIFRTGHMMIALTAEKSGYSRLCEELPVWKKKMAALEAESCLYGEIDSMPYAAGENKEAQITIEGCRNEGFRTPSQVNFVARTGWFDPNVLPYTGALKVLKVILNYEYLWPRVRVKGGAYGCMSRFGRTGEGFLVSYRDPKLRETMDVYDDLPAYLREFQVTDRDMTKYIIGAVAEMDMPKTNHAVAGWTVNAFLSHVYNDDLQKERSEVLETDVQAIRALAPYVESMLNTGAWCTIGNNNMINAEKKLFRETKDLFI